jgi:mannan endo-1,4-beta-mannosidase
LKKPVLFSEVGSRSISGQNGTHDRDILLTVVYDRIYESAKRRGAGSGALIWQLTIEQMQRFRDDFSLVARSNPSTYKLIKHQSCRLLLLFRNESATSKVDQWCHD